MASEGPPVSIVVTAHDAAETIAACLDSLAGQAGDAEILLVDDRSTDGTAKAALASGKRGLKIFQIAAYEDTALTARQVALDLGFKQALGKWIAVTDADAQASPDWISTTLAALERTSADAATGPVAFRPAGASWAKRFLAALQTVDSLFYMNWCRLVSRLGFASGMLFGSSVFLKDAYVFLGGFGETGFSLTEDLAFARLLHRGGKRIEHLRRPGVTVQACSTVSELLRRSERVGAGGASALAIGIALWMGLFLVLGAACWVNKAALALLAARYALGSLWLGLAVSRAGLWSSLPVVLVYEPLALLAGIVVGIRARSRRHVNWGGVRYER